MPMFNDRNLDFHYDDLQSMDEWSFKADFVSAMTGGTLLDQPSYTSNHSILMSESDPILPNDTYTQLSSHHPIKSIKSETDYESSMDDWRNKQVDTWNTHDVLYWLAAEAQRLGIPSPEIGIDRFAAAGVDGIRLQSMTEQDFCNLNRLYGNAIYCSLQSHRAESDRSSYQYDNMFQLSIEEPSSNLQQYDTSLPPPLDSHVLTNLDNDTSLSSSSSSSESRLAHHKTSYHHSDNESGSDSGFESERPPEKRKPGRPRGTRRKKKPEKLGRLWEFIRDLLKNREYCPSLICWDNYEEGMFRFVHSDKVAKLWGSKKDNPEMNYEKLSRAMRYYYKSKVLQPVLGRRLVYKFGPTATGWRMENPIFARSN